MEDDNLKDLFIFTEADPKPPVNPKYMRTYGHHVCPFAEKVRVILAVKNQPF